METKHTKGQWKHDGNGMIGLVEYARTIATANSIFIPKEEAEANAKLIAASPVLLEALLWAKEQFQILADKGLYPEHLMQENGGEGITKITKAIKLALE
jgi:hypothetical protein